MNRSTLPVAVIGAGPIGLAAAAHLIARGETPIVFEAGATIGAHVRSWGHVRLFSPWEYNVDLVAAELLRETGWRMPAADSYPTGAELLRDYLEPLAAHPRIAPHLRLGSRVASVTRLGRDKMKTDGREESPFLLVVEDSDGTEQHLLARAVIDASGTYGTPNPLGAHGLPAVGERPLAPAIFYGLPDVLGAQRERYAGRAILVVGSGHSAFNVVLDAVALAHEAPGTTITWAVRRPAMDDAYGGGANDRLAARGALGAEVEELVARGQVQLVTGFKVQRLVQHGAQILVESEESTIGPVDEIIATTGFRPDLSLLREVRLDLDPAVESPSALAPLIDPNLHSCGTVRPHGAEELRHPDSDIYIVGMKSYGRAPTFLMRTGYEQVRSVVAALTGDWESARRVELTLPETGVCKTSFTRAAGCCGTAEPLTLAEADSCVSDHSAIISLVER